MILLDYYMPILSGIETLNKIKELFDSQGKTAPFVVLHTSSQEEKVLTEINEYNNAYCLLKPVNATQLYQTIQKVLSQTNSSTSSNQTIEESEKVFLQNLKVLVVDDNVVNRALNKRIMQQLTPNAQLTEATDGQEAVNECSTQDFDLILMDVQMPNMDGIQATKIIRSLPQYQHIPIIGVTAGNIMGEKDKCLQSGMSSFLAKPIKQNDVFETLLNFFEIQQPIKINPADYLNRDMLNEQVGDDEDFKVYFHELIIQEFLKSKEELTNTNQRLNNLQIKSYLHKLKGTAATIGFYQLAQIANDFEFKELNDEQYANMVKLVTENIDVAIKIIEELNNE